MGAYGLTPGLFSANRSLPPHTSTVKPYPLDTFLIRESTQLVLSVSLRVLFPWLASHTFGRACHSLGGGVAYARLLA